MHRSDLFLRIDDDDFEAIVIHAEPGDQAVTFRTTGNVHLDDHDLRELRDHINLILETEQ